MELPGFCPACQHAGDHWSASNDSSMLVMEEASTLAAAVRTCLTLRTLLRILQSG